MLVIMNFTAAEEYPVWESGGINDLCSVTTKKRGKGVETNPEHAINKTREPMLDFCESQQVSAPKTVDTRR